MPEPGWFSRLSLARKIPLVAAGLIFAVGVLVSAAAIFEVRQTALNATRQHVIDVLNLVNRNDRPMGAVAIAELDSIGRSAAIGEYLRAPDDAHRPAALAALLRIRRGARVFGTEIVTDSGATVLSTNPWLGTAANEFPVIIADSSDGVVGRIRPVHDSIVYPIAARIPATHYLLVQWRHITESPENLRATERLIGPGTSLLVGNLDGSYWTNMLALTDPPRAALEDPGAVVEYTRLAATGQVISGALPLKGSPLAFAIEVPMRTLMAPVARFERVVIVLALLWVALGALAAWWFARRITTPLAQLTSAAQSLAAGEDVSPPSISRADELGRLNQSFAVMSRQVRDSRHRLEHEAAERTRELRAALDQLAAAQEAFARREKLAVLGQLAGGVGHELRNPLGVMSNAIYYLDAVQPDAPENVRNYLNLLRQQVELSTKIINDLLDFSRVAPAQRRAVELSAIVEEQLARIPALPSVRFDVAIPDELPPVDVDPVQIGQIIYNLLTNAIQAINRNGTVTLRAEAGDTGVVLRVIDSGPGIPPELLDRIFEPLFTTKARGIGLGLAVSRSLARANGGDVLAESMPGAGATFTLGMPAIAAVPT